MIQLNSVIKDFDMFTRPVVSRPFMVFKDLLQQGIALFFVHVATSAEHWKQSVFNFNSRLLLQLRRWKARVDLHFLFLFIALFGLSHLLLFQFELAEGRVLAAALIYRVIETDLVKTLQLGERILENNAAVL
jgi:hypothetical protein